MPTPTSRMIVYVIEHPTARFRWAPIARMNESTEISCGPPTNSRRETGSIANYPLRHLYPLTQSNPPTALTRLRQMITQDRNYRTTTIDILNPGTYLTSRNASAREKLIKSLLSAIHAHTHTHNHRLPSPTFCLPQLPVLLRLLALSMPFLTVAPVSSFLQRWRCSSIN